MNVYRLVKFLIGIFAFWMVVFNIQQVIFLLFIAGELKSIAVSDILFSFWYSQKLNLSAASYLLVIPLIVVMFGIIIRKSASGFKIARYITSVMLVFVLMIGLIDLGLYGNWGTKINSKALSFVVYLKEIADMIFESANLIYFVIFIFLSAVVIWSFLRMVRIPRNLHTPFFHSIVLFFIIGGILLILMRGGFQKYPVSRSSCYYSKHSTLNYAALNGFWNVLNIAASPQIKENPYKFFNKDESEEIVHNLFATFQDTTLKIMTIDKPNIIILMMESISADAIGCLGGEQDIMPEFDSLAARGLLFSNCYATGFRTDQGIVALLSSFPAQPVTAIIKNFGKFEKLPNLISEIGRLGYHTSFYYGGDIGYANIDSYLITAGINYLAGVREVPHTRETDWGAYDEDLFSFYIADSLHRPEPFLSVILTLTNHEYFDADVDKVFNRGDKKDGYLNTAYYTDQCIAQFIKDASATDWYRNTLFAITSDHAHILPKGRNYNEPGRHHIPLLIFGEPLKTEYQGKVIEKTISHLDITPTLLKQLKADHRQFRYGKDILNPTISGFAYYAFDNGFGFINDHCQIIYDYNLGKLINCEYNTDDTLCDEAEQNGKAFLEVLFQEYIDL